MSRKTTLPLSVANSDPWLLSQECDVRKSPPLHGEIFSTHDLVEALNKVITIVVCSCVCVCETTTSHPKANLSHPLFSTFFLVPVTPCPPGLGEGDNVVIPPMAGHTQLLVPEQLRVSALTPTLCNETLIMAKRGTNL